MDQQKQFFQSMTFPTSNRDPDADHCHLLGAVLALLLALRQVDLRHVPRPHLSIRATHTISFRHPLHIRVDASPWSEALACLRLTAILPTPPPSSQLYHEQHIYPKHWCSIMVGKWPWTQTRILSLKHYRIVMIIYTMPAKKVNMPQGPLHHVSCGKNTWLKIIL